MEPIFNDKKYRSNHGVIADCELLRMGTAYFFAHPKNQILENHFFHFGLLYDSSHCARNDISSHESFGDFSQWNGYLGRNPPPFSLEEDLSNIDDIVNQIKEIEGL